MNVNRWLRVLTKGGVVSHLVNCSLLIGSIVITFFVFEVGTRWILTAYHAETAQRIVDFQQSVSRSQTRKPLFQPHPYLSYCPYDIELTKSGCLINGKEFSFSAPSNTLRIACLGGSTTMRSYPKYLAEALQPCFPDKQIEVMDWGCSGWTIVESLINYTIRAKLFHPDVVIVHHGINDIAPRFRTAFLFDYSHYRKSADPFRLPQIYSWLNRSYLFTWMFLRLGYSPMDLDTLTVHPIPSDGYWPNGIVPPETDIAYRESLQSLGALCKSEGSALLLAGMVYNVTEMLFPENVNVIRAHNRISQEFAQSNEALFVDVQSQFEFKMKYFTDQVHMSPWGDRIKANVLANAIAKYLHAQPHIWVTDTLSSSDDLTGSYDEDASTDRELVIHWDRIPEGTTDVHVYVNVNGEEERFLGNVQDIQKMYLSWKPNYERIQRAFRVGPQFGKRYSFNVWFIPPENNMPLVMHDFVSFREAK